MMHLPDGMSMEFNEDEPPVPLEEFIQDVIDHLDPPLEVSGTLKVYEAAAPPDMHANCRCTLVPALPNSVRCEMENRALVTRIWGIPAAWVPDWVDRITREIIEAWSP